MRSHLDDAELAAAVAGAGLAAEAAAHLEDCAGCRRQVAGMRELVGLRRRALDDGAPDWDRQREQVLRSLPAEPAAVIPGRSRRLRPLLAAAAAALAAFGLSVVRLPGPLPDGGERPRLAAEEILAEVDALLDDDSLPGFEPIDPGLDNPEALVNGTS